MIKNHELFIEAFEDILFNLSKILFFKADTKRSSHYQKKKLFKTAIFKLLLPLHKKKEKKKTWLINRTYAVRVSSKFNSTHHQYLADEIFYRKCIFTI